MSGKTGTAEPWLRCAKAKSAKGSWWKHLVFFACLSKMSAAYDEHSAEILLKFTFYSKSPQVSNTTWCTAPTSTQTRCLYWIDRFVNQFNSWINAWLIFKLYILKTECTCCIQLLTSQLKGNSGLSFQEGRHFSMFHQFNLFFLHLIWQNSHPLQSSWNAASCHKCCRYWWQCSPF